MKLIYCLSTRISIESHCGISVPSTGFLNVLYISRENILQVLLNNKEDFQLTVIPVLSPVDFGIFLLPSHHLMQLNACREYCLFCLHDSFSGSLSLFTIYFWPTSFSCLNTFCNRKKKTEEEDEASSFASSLLFSLLSSLLSGSSRVLLPTDTTSFSMAREEKHWEEKEVVKKMSIESLFKAFTGGRTFCLKEEEIWEEDRDDCKNPPLFVHVFCL